MQIKKNIALLSRFRFPNWTIPILFLIETILAYGLLAGLQGFYFDDWPMIWQIKSGANFWDFYSYDRPFSAWTLYLTAPILGTNALAWHVFTISLRWLTTWSAWSVLNKIWTKQKQIITLIAVLFAVYPAFVQMPIAVAYSQHFLTYLVFFLSLGFMLTSLEGGKRRFWVFTLLGLITQGLHLFTMEYFWGLEVIRFLGLYFYFAQREISTFKDRIYETGKIWLPYLFIFIVAIIWRLYIYKPAEDPNELRLLSMFLSEPLNTLLHFIEIILQDTLHLLIKTWEKTLQVNLIDLKNRFLNLVWLITFGLSAGLVFYFRSISLVSDTDNNAWRKQLSLFGLAIILLGPLPAWLTNKQITIGMYSDRFALAGTLGAAILLIIFLDWVFSSRQQVVVSVAILVGLAVGLHIRTGNEYRWAWVNQQRFFWQMHWRIPNLEPNTAIFSDGAIFQYTGDYPTAFSLNLLYPPDRNKVTKLPYWFFELDSGFHRYARYYLNGQIMEDHLRNISFEGWSLDSIVIDYDPNSGNCLWIVGEGDELIYSLPTITKNALPLSDLDRIKSFPENTPDNLFGEEVAHTWCYYFEKAELARQLGDWQRVNDLAEKVVEKGFDPHNPFEWRPFVDGYLHSENYRAANELSLRVYQSEEETREMLCDLWITRIKELPQDNHLLEVAELTEDQLRCKW